MNRTAIEELMMGLRGINRVVIAVRNLEESKELYSNMLGATFIDAHWTGAPFGIHVAISWDAGIELCAPMPGRESDSAVSQFLAQKGEGIMSVYFGVDDADALMGRAAANGYSCIHALDYSQDEIDRYLGGEFLSVPGVCFGIFGSLRIHCFTGSDRHEAGV